ncbi:MAG: hypothetical protein AAGE52_01210 [Myxococcota bacterium]
MAQKRTKYTASKAVTMDGCHRMAGEVLELTSAEVEHLSKYCELEKCKAKSEPKPTGAPKNDDKPEAKPSK